MGEAELDAEAGDRNGDTSEGAIDATVKSACPSAVDRLTVPIRAAAGFLHRRALIRASRAIPRTFLFVGSALLARRGRRLAPRATPVRWPRRAGGNGRGSPGCRHDASAVTAPRGLREGGGRARRRRRPVHPERLDRGPSLVPSEAASTFRW